MEKRPCELYESDKPCPHNPSVTPSTCRRKCYRYAQWEQEKLFKAIEAIRKGVGAIYTLEENFPYILEDLERAKHEGEVDVTFMYNDLYVHPDGWAVPVPIIAKVNLPLVKEAYNGKLELVFCDEDC